MDTYTYTSLLIFTTGWVCGALSALVLGVLADED